jgi:hypothetical protein
MICLMYVAGTITPFLPAFLTSLSDGIVVFVEIRNEHVGTLADTGDRN